MESIELSSSHIPLTRLTALIHAGTGLSIGQAAHLKSCSLCRERLQVLTALDARARAEGRGQKILTGDGEPEEPGDGEIRELHSSAGESLLLFDWVAGKLEQAQTTSIKNHVEHCPSCRLEVERLVLFRRAMETCVTPEAERVVEALAEQREWEEALETTLSPYEGETASEPSPALPEASPATRGGPLPVSAHESTETSPRERSAPPRSATAWWTGWRMMLDFLRTLAPSPQWLQVGGPLVGAAALALMVTWKLGEPGSGPVQSESPATPARMGAGPVPELSQQATASADLQVKSPPSAFSLAFEADLLLPDADGNLRVMQRLDSMLHRSGAAESGSVVRFRARATGRGYLSLWQYPASTLSRASLLHTWSLMSFGGEEFPLNDAAGERLQFRLEGAEPTRTFVLVLSSVVPPSSGQAEWLERATAGRLESALTTELTWKLAGSSENAVPLPER